MPLRTNITRTDSRRAMRAMLITAIGFQVLLLPALGQKSISRITKLANDFRITFTASPAVPIQGQPVYYKGNSTGEAKFWLWDFGDGWTSTRQNEVHIFRKAGFHRVTLTVTNDRGSKKAIRTYTVMPDSLAASFVFSPSSPRIGQTVSFADTTSGDPTSWAWDFGDGSTSTVKNPSYAFSKAGYYSVTLTATTSSGSRRATLPITVASMSILTPSFSYSPASPAAGQSVQFTDTSTGNPTAWLWNFGDGSTSASRNPSHVYTTAGSYNVTLTSTNSAGSKNASRPVVVTATPVASFTYNPSFPDVGQPVQFSDLSTGGPTTWLWDFNDGSTSSGRNPSHAFSSAGTYHVSLVVSGVSGSSSTGQNVLVGSGGVTTGAYWVSPTGTATWVNARSETPLAGAACTSLSAANANASPGDTVYLRGGTYATSICPAHSGTRDSRITFQAYPGETPTLVIDTEAKGRWAIKLDGRSYIRIIGITSSRSLAFFWIGYGSCYNEIAYCNFDRSSYLYALGLISFYGTGLLGEGPGSNHNWLHHNVFSRYGCITDGNDNGTIRITCLENDPTAYNTFEDNVFFYGGHDLIDIGGRYNVLRNNVFHNEEAYYQDLTGTSTNSPASGYFGNRCLHLSNYGEGVGSTYRTLIEGNRIGHGGTPPDDDAAFGIVDAGVQSLIRYNDIFGCGGDGYYSRIQGDMALKSGSHARIYNNNIYHNGYGDEDIGNGFKWGLDFPGMPIASYYPWPIDVIVKNNIVYDNFRGGLGIAYSATGQVSYENNYESNPRYANTNMSDKTSLTLPDLSLQADSPCINAGLPLTQAYGSGSNSLTLVVDDPLFFQDGSWGSALTHGVTHFPDWIAVGTVENIARIAAIDYASKTITLATPLTWTDDAKIWLYSDSGGRRVLKGTAPDIGAHEIDR